MPPHFIAKQLSRPAGFLAPVIGALMNRHNAAMNRFALKLVDARPQDCVLEIGFGGVTMPALLKSAGYVVGVDRSPDVVRAAKARYAKALHSGRANFIEGQVERLPVGDAGFTKVLTVNTVYFWSSLDAGFSEIRRALDRGGRAIIGFLPKARMEKGGFPTDIFTPRAPQDVIASLERCGFRDTLVERPTPKTAWNVITAVKA